MSDLQALKTQLTTILGNSAHFWPNKKPKLDDYYEAYLWAETVSVAQALNWTVNFVNAGASNDQFTFRMGPGLITAGKYTYATLSKGTKSGELHIGIKVMGDSQTLHEFDIVAIDHSYRAHAIGAQPHHRHVRLHVEAKFHTNDLSLGIARGIVGLGRDCPSIEPFLVAKNIASPNVRPLIKHFHGHFVERVFPFAPGVTPYFHTCIKSALNKWEAAP